MKRASTFILVLIISSQSTLAQSGKAANLSHDVEKAVMKVSSTDTSPPGPRQLESSNIGLTTYPSLQCQRPQFDLQVPKEVKKDATNYLAGVKGAVTGVNDDQGAEDHNAQVKKYNDAAKKYNAQMTAFNSCAQTYTANANADLHRIREKIEAAVNARVAITPSGLKAGVGTNIGLTDYPAATCVKPSDIDESLKPGSVPPLEAKEPEIEAYNLLVTRYNGALNKHNSQTAEYNICIQAYVANANADIRRIQSVLDESVSGAQSGNVETVTIAGAKNLELPAKNFADSYAAPDLQINKIP